MNKLEEVAGHIRQASSVTFIIGAGASKAAGIPLAGELVDRICQDRKYQHCLNGLTESEKKNYGKVMARLTPQEREAFITPILENSGINWGQIALAALLRAKLVGRVLTFNFDLVLERAAALLGLQLPVYDFGVAPTRDIARIAKAGIVHLHGQGYGLVLLNTEDETRKHRELLRPLLADSVRNSVTIIVGYSGEADGAFDVILEEFNSHTRLIWLGFSPSPPSHLKPLLEKPYAEYVGDCDFDRSMIEIAEALGVWPPTLVNNPIRHLISELDVVKPYPVKVDTEIDVLSRTVARLTEFADKWEQHADNEEQALKSVLNRDISEDQLLAALTTLEDLSGEARRALAWSFVERGNSLSDEAGTLSGAEAAAKFKEAYYKYAQAVTIKPDMHEAFYNWGNALSAEARTLSGAEAAAKFAAAYGKYAQAVAIKPDKHEAFNNWGNALSAEARTLSGAEAAAKLAAAYGKYAQAVAIKPDKHEAFNNWGNGLLAEARTLSGAEAAAKFKEAYDKYAQAVTIKPDMHEAFYNWGNALSDEARTLSGAEAAAKFKEAYDKYAQAVAINPDKHEAFNNWGNALSDEARTLFGAEAAAKFKEAYDKYAQAVTIKPDLHEAFYNWGNALSDEARTLFGAEAAAKFKEAYGKYAQAVAIKPDMHEAFHNWGTALSDEARTLSGAEAAAKFKEAYDKYAQAVAINPDKHEAFNNWGLALQDEAATLSGAEAAAKFKEAYDKYAQAVVINPDKHEAFNNWGNALMAEARTLSGAEAAAKFKEAYDKYAQAVAIKPDKHEAFDNWGNALLAEARTLSGAEAAAKFGEAEEKLNKSKAIAELPSYNLARVLALTGRENEAMAELLDCQRTGELPAKEYLLADSDLDPLRDRADFQKFVSKLK